MLRNYFQYFTLFIYLFVYFYKYIHQVSLICHLLSPDRVSPTIYPTPVAMVTTSRLDPLPFSHGDNGAGSQPLCRHAHAQCALPHDPISYFNRPNKRERDIRKMATALVVSVPQHIPEFATRRFSTFTHLRQRYIFECHWRSFEKLPVSRTR